MLIPFQVSRGVVEKLKSASPEFYLKLRHRYYNLIGLAQWLWVQYSPIFTGGIADPYDHEFWLTKEEADWKGFARTITRHVKPKSVLDVGCGSGNLAAAIKDDESQPRVVGLDGSPVSIARARAKGLQVSTLDIVRSSYKDLEKLRTELGRFDLVLCLEVAEHFPAWYSGKLLTLLTGFADVIIFSAAHSNQGGTLHVNEQPAEYWIAKFDRLGFRLAAFDQTFRNNVQQLEIASWYKENIHVFERHQ
jgi:SAM-dependent methyltransferase